MANKNYINNIIKAANHGDGDSQFELSQALESGHDIDQDLQRSFRLCKKSANGGNVNAKNRLAIKYLKGMGTQINLIKALLILEKLSHQGDMEAQYSLHGVHILLQNEEEAFKLAKLAAKQGHDKAQFNVGIMYKEGIGMDKSLFKSIYWLTLSANQNNLGAILSLAKIYKAKEDYPKAIEFYGKAAKLGNDHAEEEILNLMQSSKRINVQDILSSTLTSDKTGDELFQEKLDFDYELVQKIRK